MVNWGTGRSLPAALSIGRHSLTLQAQDLDGNISLVQAEVVIEEGAVYKSQAADAAVEADV